MPYHNNIKEGNCCSVALYGPILHFQHFMCSNIHTIYHLDPQSFVTYLYMANFYLAHTCGYCDISKHLLWYLVYIFDLYWWNNLTSLHFLMHYLWLFRFKEATTKSFCCQPKSDFVWHREGFRPSIEAWRLL